MYYIYHYCALICRQGDAQAYSDGIVEMPWCIKDKRGLSCIRTIVAHRMGVMPEQVTLLSLTLLSVEEESDDPVSVADPSGDRPG